MNILKKLCCMFFITLITNIQASESARHVKFKSPLSTRHEYEVESLTTYCKELREHNLDISMQQDTIINEMTEEEKIEFDRRITNRLIIKENQKSFLESYNQKNATLKEQKEIYQRIQKDQRIQKQNHVEEQKICNSHLSILSLVVVGGISLYYFNHYK